MTSAAGRLPFEERAVLRDGSTVHIRPIRADDRERLIAAFDRLSPESRYRRFVAPVKRLDEKTLTYLTEVDHERHEALVAVEPDNGELIGVARYVATARAGDQAEVAMVVADAWQGRGLASVLLAELTSRARENGITHFVASCLADNRDALDVLESLGTAAEHYDGGVCDLSITLSAENADRALERALGHAGRDAVEFFPLAGKEAKVRPEG